MQLQKKKRKRMGERRKKKKIKYQVFCFRVNRPLESLRSNVYKRTIQDSFLVIRRLFT